MPTSLCYLRQSRTDGKRAPRIDRFPLEIYTQKNEKHSQLFKFYPDYLIFFANVTETRKTQKTFAKSKEILKNQKNGKNMQKKKAKKIPPAVKASGTGIFETFLFGGIPEKRMDFMQPAITQAAHIYNHTTKQKNNTAGEEKSARGGEGGARPCGCRAMRLADTAATLPAVFLCVFQHDRDA